MQPVNTRAANSPHLALVLGSGGVRSIAALGINEVLTQAGMRPDLVVGCSSGALFGACIAAGMTGQHGLAATQRLWSAELTGKKRWSAYLELIAPRLMRFNAGFSLRDARLIRERVERAFGNSRLQDLPIPLRVVATEAQTGNAVVLTHGRVADAVRASMALPFLFPSVELDGRRLSDGVISDPLPVAAARDAAAVITLGFRGAMPRRIDRPSRLIAQVTTAMINNLQQARIEAARAAGQRMFHIELDIDRRIGLWDTAAMPRIFEIGQRAAADHLPAIRRLLDAPPRSPLHAPFAAVRHL
jgi:NTE family protein